MTHDTPAPQMEPSNLDEIVEDYARSIDQRERADGIELAGCREILKYARSELAALRLSLSAAKAREADLERLVLAPMREISHYEGYDGSLCADPEDCPNCTAQAALANYDAAARRSMKGGE